MSVPSSSGTLLDTPASRIERRVEAGEAVILFDGVCTLCNAAVDFILRRDAAGRFAFASLQSDVATAYLKKRGLDLPDTPDTLVLIDADGLHERSTAALRIARGLPGAWLLLYAFILVPPPLRDAVYRIVAAHRYRWFGRRETCRLPTPAERVRFV